LKQRVEALFGALFFHVRIAMKIEMNAMELVIGSRRARYQSLISSRKALDTRLCDLFNTCCRFFLHDVMDVQLIASDMHHCGI